MKRLIAFTLLLSLLLLPACAAPNALYTVDDVDALKEEVNTAWRARGNDAIYNFEYFGSCNGYHIVKFLSGPVAQAYHSKGVAGYVFEYATSFCLKAYKDGEFIELKEAYESRLVSKEAIAKAAELHEAVQAEKKEKNRIQSEFMNSHFVNIREFRFYGDENGRHILFVKTTKATIPLTVKQIAGSEFSHQGVFSLYAYIDGEFIDLEQAYKKSLISQEAIAAAAKKHVDYETE
jgi:hypothetical protein